MLLIYLAKNDTFAQNVCNYLNLDLNKNKIMYNVGCTIVFGEEKFLFLNEQQIDNIMQDFDKEKTEILIVSTHKSKHDFNIISCHYTGNYGIAELGGESYTLNPASINLLNTILRRIISFEDPKFLLEVTHHGPTSKYPLCFFEIGPNDSSYKNQKNIEDYCKVLKEIMDNYKTEETEKKCSKTFILVGAEHYISKDDYTKITNKIKETLGNPDLELQIGHIMPKYALLPLLKNPNNLNKMFEEMVEKSATKICVINKSYVKQSELLRETFEKIKTEKGINLEIIKI